MKTQGSLLCWGRSWCWRVRALPIPIGELSEAELLEYVGRPKKEQEMPGGPVHR